jgi:hypothetical protein
MNGRGSCEKELKGAGCTNLVAVVERVSMKLLRQRGFI